MLKPIVIATAIGGTLDILFAMILTVAFGREIGGMLRYVASGPFPAATGMGAGGAIIGLLVHFALMAVMAAAFVLAARRVPALFERPIQWGVIYGLITYLVMNWIVVPLRFGTPLPPKPLSIATQLFAHVVLVGIPIALVTARHLRPKTA
jgi:membrane associated rhomboid family serine protease